jgi:hypothetical protein
LLAFLTLCHDQKPARDSQTIVAYRLVFFGLLFCRFSGGDGTAAAASAAGGWLLRPARRVAMVGGAAAGSRRQAASGNKATKMDEEAQSREI